MLEAEITLPIKDSRNSLMSDDPGLPYILAQCPENSTVLLETPRRRQAWRVIDGIWKCVGDIHKEVF